MQYMYMYAGRVSIGMHAVGVILKKVLVIVTIYMSFVCPDISPTVTHTHTERERARERES